MVGHYVTHVRHLFVAVPRKFLPPVVERHVLGTGLALSKLLLGLVMSGLAAWVMVWAPHIAARDAAHYSGLVVSASLLDKIQENLRNRTGRIFEVFL